jgi:hypothetical protein
LEILLAGTVQHDRIATRERRHHSRLQTENGSFPFGGHYEIDIAADGHVAAERGFTRSCITMPKPEGSEGKRPAGLVLSHLMDPQPTEIHVFMQFGIGMPLYVMIADPKALWKVESGLIERTSDKGFEP